MRILVCLSSLPRNFEYFVESFQNHVLNHIGHSVDIVGHFPEQPDKNALNELLSQVDNQLVKIEADPTFTWELSYNENLIGNQGIEGNLLQWHSMISCNELKKQLEEKVGQPYDWVIWSRPDICFFNDLFIDFNQSSEHIYLPPIDNHEGLYDRFCYGGSQVMDARMDILSYFLEEWYPNYHNDPKYLKRKGKIWARYSCWNPEMVFKQLLLDRGINYRYIDLVTGKFRQKHNQEGMLKTYVSLPFFDVKHDCQEVKLIHKKLKKVLVEKFEDERTALIDYTNLKELIGEY